MSVETRKRSEQTAVRLECAVGNITSLLENLRNINAWWFANYRGEKVKS